VGKTELLAELETEFQALLKAVEGLTDEQMLKVWYGDWCVRDILGHIIGWHHEMDDVLERISRGERPVPEGVDYNDADPWNAKFADTWNRASPTAIVQELIASKELFVTAAKLVPEERFAEGKSAQRIVTTTGTNHYGEHAPEILEWRKKEGI
jgi:hypothetical protein